MMREFVFWVSFGFYVAAFAVMRVGISRRDKTISELRAALAEAKQGRPS